MEERFAWLKTMDARVSSATIILEDTAGRALIVKANYKEHWTFPGGIIDAGETPKQAAVREVSEEVGLTIDPASVSFAWVASRSSRMAQTYQFVFRAALPAGSEALVNLQAEEIDEYVFVSKDDIARGERNYGKVIEHWAAGVTGYVEQTFGSAE
jgi:8-oxo-dGTP pyrophosphatase MutT (NUDIX family)